MNTNGNAEKLIMGIDPGTNFMAETDVQKWSCLESWT